MKPDPVNVLCMNNGYDIILTNDGYTACQADQGGCFMERYIALLRGINVGGNNKIAMPTLKAAFEEAGFNEVVTYINSGNVLFSSERCDETELIAVCEKLIAKTFQLQIPVTVISAKDLAEAVAHRPDWWNQNEDSKHNAIFVIPPATTEEICREIGETKPEYEQMAHYGQVIFWSAPIATFSRTRLSKVVSTTKLLRSVTIRNANTTMKLEKLSQG